MGIGCHESKTYGSIVLLNFKEGNREAFHTHAFNSISWVLLGMQKLQTCLKQQR